MKINERALLNYGSYRLDIDDTRRILAIDDLLFV